MRIKGVIFDFNGTLFWDTKLHNNAWDIFLEKKGICLNYQEKSEKIHGKNNKEIMTALFSAELTDESIKKLSVEKESIYQELCLKQKMELAPGVTDFFKFLNIEHIPYTIATASEIYNLEFYFNHFDLELFFDKSKVVYNDGTIKSKPDPHIFQKAMEILTLKENEVLIFEDSISGILAAENANVKKIIIVNSNNDDYSKWNHQIIRNFSEVDRKIFASV